MKKLLTIALALVMVLALAVPAFAIYGWEAAPATESTLAEGFTLSLDAYEYVPATTGFDWQNNYYANWTPTTGIVAGSNVRFVATIDAIANSGIQSDVLKDIDTLKLTVSSSNLYIYKAEARRFVKNSTTGIYEYDKDYAVKDITSNNIASGSTKFAWTMKDITNSKKAVKVQVMFQATVVATADVNVAATLSCGASAFTDDGYFYFTKNKEDYTVFHDGNYFYVWNDDTPLRVVRFTVDSANKVTDIHVSLQDLLDSYVTNVTALTNKEQAALAKAVYNVYVAEAMTGSPYVNGILATYTDYMPLDPYYIAYTLWTGVVIGSDYALTNSKVFWNKNDDGDYDYTYECLTDSGMDAFEKYIGSAGLNLKLSEPSDATLRGEGISYILGTLDDDASYLTKRAKVFNAFAVDDEFNAYDGIFQGFTTAADLERAVINNRMAKNSYVYFVNSGNYTYDLSKAVVKVSNPYTLNGADPANILGQIGKLSSTGTVVAPYYRASYNVNTGVLTFGNEGEYLNAGYDKILDVDGRNVATVMNAVPNASTAVIKTGTTSYTFAELSNLNTKLSGIDSKHIEVYAGIDKYNMADQFVVETNYFESGSTYKYLKATFDEITSVLAFNWDGTTSYMYEDAFLANFAAKMSISKSITYTAYAAQLVVADPNAQPPQTGDASSVLGFVMIALAVVAAGAVVVKKVRA